jgi:hypothetical protein
LQPSARGRFDAGTVQPARPVGVPALVVRLRETAAHLVAFSESKLLLREAASVIERLDREGGAHAAEVLRLEAELTRERNARRAP